MSNNVSSKGKRQRCTSRKGCVAVVLIRQVAADECTSREAAGCSSHCGGFTAGFERILSSPTSNANSIISQCRGAWVCVCVCGCVCVCETILVEVCCATCTPSCRWRIKRTFRLEASQHILVYHRASAEHTHTHSPTHVHTHTHSLLSKCAIVWYFSSPFSRHIGSKAWQRMSGCLPAITHLRRENQQWPQKPNALIGAGLEQGLQIKGSFLGDIVHYTLRSEPVIAQD